MVSQLQFIDPLNRRDLTRDEIVNLDAYLTRHGLSTTHHVTEAYDAKGVTLSRAGAAASTAAGRAAILQQEAAVLYQTLFGTVVGTSPAAASSSSLAQGYRAHEQRQQRTYRNNNNTPDSDAVVDEDTGIYGDASGILVIDDDMNPGLRGADMNTALRREATEFVPTAGAASAPYTTWSASHISARLGHQAQTRAADFPALAKPDTPPPPAQVTPPKKNLPKSNTLAKIAVSVKKTDPEERQRMWEAHEEFVRRSRMANLTFGGEAPPATTINDNPPMGTISIDGTGPTEAQLERNRVMAEALGVQPSTIRGGGVIAKSGWARPTNSPATPVLDEFGNELNATVYPEELLALARDKLGILTKLERRWKLFLEDDKASSLPLWPMDRLGRTLVHHYSDFWKLQTESFDPEPKRYVHCVKLLDTMAPTPLLSEALRHRPAAPKQLNIAELPRHSGAAPVHPDSSRWSQLEETKASSSSAVPAERPKLELQKRTLPLEVVPPTGSDDANRERMEAQARLVKMEEDRLKRMEDKARKDKERAEAKRRALEAAFASDSEEEDTGGRLRGNDNDDDSEWTQVEEQYPGDFSDEEG
eukprot:CAMPEP_0172451978 /NCGR_PEP_ID=MMETSP1065-20121228/9769_1 /TAXON_ID=265537 /ORGANISM="Amphiprora paludosa, Strain CCMP125" /LENGTH=588 /DNA_ID=CAMNT_0013203949 /DNA_START=1 /DNA_END=1767 /DNA_ORIENTATION=+